ncbi:hypothetical protein BC938DRAFT_477275 [Jimgerdemannia flammicorona]|uniref:Uncharacterized protein n=1 Tax=Jimgerdemannia flammicorona TaxID=994334 RepID=A0A433PAX7_9FUNG|nr:hypothetical protein BC938DRAFT_477275 [Jimgerdemannia flammicorona]
MSSQAPLSGTVRHITRIVGFKSQKVYSSLKDVKKKTTYVNEILDGGEAPIFQVTPEDQPERVFKANSSSGVWKQILDEIQAKGVTAKTHASGPEMLGLTNLGVTKYIQVRARFPDSNGEMTNAERCTKYVMQRWIEDEHNTYRGSSAGPSSITIVHEHPENGFNEE